MKGRCRYPGLCPLLRGRGTFEQVQPGQYHDLGRGARLEALAVGERGAVLRLAWERFSAFLPVGMDLATLKAHLVQPDLTPATALLLAEEGAAELNPPEWIARLHPQMVLLSVDVRNQGEIPKEILDTLEGFTLLRIDRKDWIQLATDGEQI